MTQMMQQFMLSAKKKTWYFPVMEIRIGNLGHFTILKWRDVTVFSSTFTAIASKC